METNSKIAAKLVGVMRDIRQPAQSARHQYQKYDYATRDDIFEVVRVALVHAGIAVCTSLKLERQEPAAPTSKGVPQTRSIIRLDVQLIDSESGEELPSSWYGEAVTTEDKGIQGAATQAARFWAIQQFMLMDGRESELHSDEPTAAAEPARPSSNTAVSELRGVLTSKGLNNTEVGQMLAYICAQEKKGSIDQINAQRLGGWMRKLADSDAEVIRKRIQVAA